MAIVVAMNGRHLRHRATLAGTVAATAAGALTVGLVTGVAHAASTSGTTTSNSSAGSTTSGSGSTSSTSDSSDPMTQLGGASDNSHAQGGSHGS